MPFLAISVAVLLIENTQKIKMDFLSNSLDRFWMAEPKNWPFDLSLDSLSRVLWVAFTSVTFYKVPEEHGHVYLVGLYIFITIDITLLNLNPFR